MQLVFRPFQTEMYRNGVTRKFVCIRISCCSHRGTTSLIAIAAHFNSFGGTMASCRNFVIRLSGSAEVFREKTMMKKTSRVAVHNHQGDTWCRRFLEALRCREMFAIRWRRNDSTSASHPTTPIVAVSAHHLYGCMQQHTSSCLTSPLSCSLAPWPSRCTTRSIWLQSKSWSVAVALRSAARLSMSVECRYQL